MGGVHLADILLAFDRIAVKIQQLYIEVLWYLLLK